MLFWLGYGWEMVKLIALSATKQSSFLRIDGSVRKFFCSEKRYTQPVTLINMNKEMEKWREGKIIHSISSRFFHSFFFFCSRHCIRFPNKWPILRNRDLYLSKHPLNIIKHKNIAFVYIFVISGTYNRTKKCRLFKIALG